MQLAGRVADLGEVVADQGRGGGPAVGAGEGVGEGLAVPVRERLGELCDELTPALQSGDAVADSGKAVFEPLDAIGNGDALRIGVLVGGHRPRFDRADGDRLVAGAADGQAVGVDLAGKIRQDDGRIAGRQGERDAADDARPRREDRDQLDRTRRIDRAGERRHRERQGQPESNSHAHDHGGTSAAAQLTTIVRKQLWFGLATIMEEAWRGGG